MGSRRREVLFDNFLALFGVVRPGPETPRSAHTPYVARAQKPRVPTRTELNAIGRRLGFHVSTDGLWRLDEWVVVTQLRLRSSGAHNDLPAHISSMRATGQIDDDNVVRAFYVYEENTPAMNILFSRLMDEDDHRPTMPYLIGIDALRHLQYEVRAGRMGQVDARDVLIKVENSAAVGL